MADVPEERRTGALFASCYISMSYSSFNSLYSFFFMCWAQESCNELQIE